MLIVDCLWIYAGFEGKGKLLAQRKECPGKGTDGMLSFIASIK